ncbi:hypothetical protein HOLleu_12352 [Holothuria leucospilota]|uniref:Uncharacterized protein n=1 Tax=Holothuria leucospilota TaxID=206669 RepID=A0A9Q1CAR3_HOLLE|nr:hypothetical protein HOLleu_12352 [Holothuria leucospilota]
MPDHCVQTHSSFYCHAGKRALSYFENLVPAIAGIRRVPWIKSSSIEYCVCIFTHKATQEMSRLRLAQWKPCLYCILHEAEHNSHWLSRFTFSAWVTQLHLN